MLVELKCEHCKRYIGKAYGTIVAELRCPNTSCKATTQFKVINGDAVSDIRFKFAEPPQPPKPKATEPEVS